MKHIRAYTLVIFSAACSPCFGESQQGTHLDAVIHDRALQGVSGRLAINQSAGHGNAQQNLAALAVDAAGADTHLQVGVAASGTDAIAPSQTRASIQDQAFANSRGLISVNQASGNNNIQLNGFAVAMGLNGGALNIADLAAVSSPSASADPDETTPSDPQVRLDASTYKDSRGFVQINQVAGSDNRSANTFALHVSTEAQIQ